MTDYTNALARLLMQQQQPQDDFVADYASSAPTSDGRRSMQAGAGAMGLGALLAGTSPAWLMGGGYGVPPMLTQAGTGFGAMAAGASEIGRGSQFLRGQHPDQEQMDHSLRMMQYYGQSPRGFGPK